MIRATISGDLDRAERIRLRLIDRGGTKRLLARLGGVVIAASKKRIADQVGLEVPFAPRAKKEVKRKLLARLGKYLFARIESGQVVIGFRNGLTGAIARAQQEGVTEQVTAASLANDARREVKRAEAQARLDKKRRKKPHRATGASGTQATTDQAKRLKELGFKKSVAWIKATFTREQAGYIIRKMEHRAPKQAWTITLPPRPFLGATAADRQKLVSIIRDALAGR